MKKTAIILGVIIIGLASTVAVVFFTKSDILGNSQGWIRSDFYIRGNLNVAGTVISATSTVLALKTPGVILTTDGQEVKINTYKGANSDGVNLFAGGGGQSSVGAFMASYLGSNNTSYGQLALTNNTTGNKNNAIGAQAMQANTTGNNNNAQGFGSLLFNTIGQSNTAFGSQSLYSLAPTTAAQGNQNTAVGYTSAYSVTIGSDNTFIGANAGYNALQKIDVVSSTAIGFGAYTTKNNQMVFGTSAVTETLLNGNVGINTTNPSSSLHIVNGTATTTVIIGSTGSGVNPGVTCQWNGTNYTKTYFGPDSITPIIATSTSC